MTIAHTMPAAEVNRRALALVARLSSYVADQQPDLIPCVNVDPTWLPAEINGTPLPKPSIHHTIVKCEVCGVDMWIGLFQKQAQGLRLCYLCLVVFYMLHQNHDMIEFRPLDPNADNIPRRT